MTTTTSYAIFQDKKVAYSSIGKGFPLVFIHGFCEDRSMWKAFIQPFIKNYQIITIDVGGFGETELPENLTITIMANQINAVLSAEEIDRCLMIGHSMGGYAALAFAENFGKKLAGLTMFHTHPFADAEKKKINRDKGLAFLDKYGVERFVTPLLPQLFSPMAKIKFKSIIQDLIFKAKNYSKEAVYKALFAMKNRPDRASVLSKIDCPVQFIIGKLDASVTLDQSLQQTSLPKVADVQIFSEMGHMGMFTAQEKTQEILIDFIKFCIKLE